jgi:hypothetical protein
MEKACFHSTSGHCLGPAPAQPPPLLHPALSFSPQTDQRSGPGPVPHRSRGSRSCGSPKGLALFCCTKAEFFIWVPVRFPHHFPLPLISPRLPSTIALRLAPFSLYAVVGLAWLPVGSLLGSTFPLGFSISPCVARPAPSLLLSSLFPAPIPRQTTFPCTCNPITNCRVSLEVISPEGTSLPEPDSYREGSATTGMAVLGQKLA